MTTQKEPTKDIAVLCATYDGAEYLDQQLLSIKKQINVSVDIYLSADISSDSTYDICQQWAFKNKNITLLQYGETFGGAAKNFYRLIQDVDFSRYSYVALSDQDDIWFRDKLFRAISSIEERKVDVYSSNVIAFWSDGSQKVIIKSQPQTDYDFLFESGGPGCTFVFECSTLMLFKLYLLEHQTEVNDVVFHDWMLYAFCRSIGKKWFIDPEPGMLYRQHSSNQFGSNSGRKALSTRLSMVKGKWYRQEVEKIFTLSGVSQTKFSLNRPFLIFNFWKLRRGIWSKFVLLTFLLFGLF